MLWHPTVKIRPFFETAGPIETAAIIGLVLFLASEIIPHTPIAGNSVVEAILNALRTVFPHGSHTDK